MNSARFSYISPTGTFYSEHKEKSKKRVGHIIDGGYFDNYGAGTLKDLVTWLEVNKVKQRNQQLIVIAITNDSNNRLKAYNQDEKPEQPSPWKIVNEIAAPPIGLARTRGGHGMLAFKLLQQQVNSWRNSEGDTFDKKPTLYHFYLPKEEGQEPPLGWILSEQAQKTMQDQFTAGENCKHYEEIAAQFGAPIKEQCVAL